MRTVSLVLVVVLVCACATAAPPKATEPQLSNDQLLRRVEGRIDFLAQMATKAENEALRASWVQLYGEEVAFYMLYLERVENVRSLDALMAHLRAMRSPGTREMCAKTTEAQLCR